MVMLYYFWGNKFWNDTNVRKDAFYEASFLFGVSIITKNIEKIG